MPEYDIPVVRIVAKGCPSTRSEKRNVPRARNMLLRAFQDNHWPGNAMFAITPGGFVKVPVQDPWDRERGWSTSAEDFRTLVPHARKAVDEVVTPQVCLTVSGATAGVPAARWREALGDIQSATTTATRR